MQKELNNSRKAYLKNSPENISEEFSSHDEHGTNYTDESSAINTELRTAFCMYCYGSFLSGNMSV